jgi:hypothetical protein
MSGSQALQSIIDRDNNQGASLDRLENHKRAQSLSHRPATTYTANTRPKATSTSDNSAIACSADNPIYTVYTAVHVVTHAA